MSHVFRYQGPTEIPESSAPKLLRKRRGSGASPPLLIAADSIALTTFNGTQDIEAFSEFENAIWVTLTRKESDLIALANPGKIPPKVLEDEHPWLPTQTYYNDSETNYKNLQRVVRKFEGHLISAAAFCDEKWKTICNAIRMKNDNDARFYTAWHLPIQDTYILEEQREDRSVIAIDFNAMYSACMQQRFPKPSRLRHVSYNRFLSSNESLPVGLYRCRLQGNASPFIQKHNPLRSFVSGRQLQASLAEPVEVDLNEFEVEFYRHHFEKVFLADGVISDTCIAHPLAREARRSFAKRQHYRKQGNKPLADREKYLSTLLSSCSQRPSRTRDNSLSKHEVSERLQCHYGVKERDDEPCSASMVWMQGRKGIKIVETSGGLSIDGPNLLDGSACFALNQRIVARGRVVLLEMMERLFNDVQDVEICYVNIDSIHFSLPKNRLDYILDTLRSEASEDMGSFKIEAVTDHGLWLEPGRYWLYGQTIEKFKNRSIGNRTSPFSDHAIFVTNRNIGELSIPIRRTIQMDRTMSDARTMFAATQTGLNRQALITVGQNTAFSEILAQMEGNRLCGIPKRMLAFKKLQERMEGSGPAASRPN